MSEHNHYIENSVQEEILKRHYIKFALENIKFYNNSIPDKHFVSCEDGAAVCEGGPEYCKQVTYSPKDIGEIADPENRRKLAIEILQKDSKVRWKNLDVIALEVEKTDVRIETPNEFYLSIYARAVTEERVPPN